VEKGFGKMSLKKRSKIEIIKDILLTIQKNQNKIPPTKLMRLSNLSFQMFQEYLEELEKKGIIIIENVNEKRSFYCLTEKGQQFLDKYKEFNSFLEEFGF